MPRFFFHLENGRESIRDDEGTVVDDAKTAVRQALQSVDEMREAGELPVAGDGWTVVICDDRNNELGRIPVAEETLRARRLA
ncbi:hypothetical protein HCU64_16660 [Methylobacterium sp. C25]|uniref:DUF6894 family protein n=1 Tax=Methylobacterium sp. C25 TaxID=2721622 RepID=UPI001F339D6D|nr:hypothetical protein [Methylobacterium sp. C25]MCE4225389.1 hypothetical protein [Methylobacterium sp. C25]